MHVSRLANSAGQSSYDVLILGAGAAGLFCAMYAGRGGQRVLLLDHAPRVGKKILISGGGRCNFTNLHTTAANFLSANPHFAKSALARYTPADFLALVEQHQIPWHEKTLGQLFCDRSAQDIVLMLEKECAAAQVETLVNTSVRSIDRGPDQQDLFRVETDRGVFSAPALVVATGGLSIPKMGATPFGYQVAEQFGLKLQPCRPALVPLTFAPQDLKNYAPLAGISTEVVATYRRRALPRKTSLYPSGRQRAGSAADFVVLAARGTGCHRPGARPGLDQSGARPNQST